LAQEGAAKIFRPLREQYDFIVVDSAPLLPVTDSLLVAQEVDAVLFSVFRDVSRVGRIFAAWQRLALLGVRAPGAVVTGAPRVEGYGRKYPYAKRERQLTQTVNQ